MKRRKTLCLLFLLFFTSISTAATLYVPSGYPTIQGAIDDANDGDTIIVAASGSPYSEDIDFSGKDIRVYSDDVNNPGNTVIWGTGGGSVVTFQNGEYPTAELKGFTISNGSAAYGGGIECILSSPTISNCIITANTALAFGGGVDIYMASPTLLNCLITANTAVDGGGINCDTDDFGFSPTISDCNISGNNSTGVGAGINCYKSNPSIDNCLIVNNTAAAKGGAVYLLDSSPLIYNCTILGNTGLNNFGGIYRDGSDGIAEIVNTILWNNADDLYNCVGMTAHSCIEDADSGPGNISDNPNFKAGPLGNYYLSQINAGQLEDSPCVDAGADMVWFYGLDTFTTSTDNDLDSGIVDIGYHYTVSGPLVNYQLVTAVTGSNGSIDPCLPSPGGSYPRFTEVLLTAMPDAGYKVLAWTGTDDNASTDVNNAVTMDSNESVTVSFTPIPQYTLTVTAGANGNIEPRRGGTYPENTVVTVTAIPSEGYRVLAWTGTDNDTSTDATNTVTMTANKTVTVTFVQYHTIHVPGGDPQNPMEIQTAINQAANGDVIVIAPGTYPGLGYNINKNITITGSDPQDPCVVANTIIDGTNQQTFGFQLNGTGGGTCILNGLTIANAARIGVKRIPPVLVPGTPGNGNQGGIVYGAGIDVQGNHIIANCIIRNCRVTGGGGSDGLPGDEGDLSDPCNLVQPTHQGGSGGSGGHGRGAGIYIRTGNPIILNTIIDGCIVTGGPSTVGMDGLEARPPDINYPGGRGGDGGSGGDALGGGVYCVNGTGPRFENCTISNCMVIAGNASDGGNGGAGADSAITDPFGIVGNGRGGDGGVPGTAYGAGIYCDNTVTATFIDCSFVNNQAYGGIAGDGGVAQANNLTSWFRGGLGGLCDISSTVTGSPQGLGIGPENYSANGGGVFINTSVTRADFNDCTLTGNIARGAISGIGGRHSLVPGNLSRFSEPLFHYRIPSYGAGLYSGDTTALRFNNCTVEDNRTIIEGNRYAGDFYGNDAGGIAVAYTLDQYTGYGGGMCFDGGGVGNNTTYVELNDCNISDNRAPIGGGIYGGALTDFHIFDSNFEDNRAYLGGGLFAIDNIPATISGCRFQGNKADKILDVDPGDPGAVVELVYGQGGGIYCFATDALISDCMITDNFASSSGGGLYVAGEGDAAFPVFFDPVIHNCLITYNTAVNSGGGISCTWGVEPRISNCTIADNDAIGTNSYGGGIYVSYESEPSVINSIIWNNTGPNGSQIALRNGGSYLLPPTMDITYSDVEIRYTEEGELWEFETEPDLIDVNIPSIRPGFDVNDFNDSGSLNRNDDFSTELVDIGFSINYFGDVYSAFYINNNGNVTFDGPMMTYTPFGLTGDIGTSIIAPFFADVDTRDPNSNIVTFGPGTVDGHNAFGINWVDVGYYNSYSDKLNSFQLIIIERSDRGLGDFDIEFNYEKIEWETGDASGGQDGFGGESARVGFSNGSGIEGTYFEFEGSGVHGAFLDSSPTALINRARRGTTAGRFGFTVRGGIPEMPKPASFPIYVEEECLLNGIEPNDWDPADPNTNPWIPWDPNTHNITEDPLFLGNYLLRQILAGQLVDSNCVNAGSVFASAVGLDNYTTRTDSVNDVNVVDLGYHHRPFEVTEYNLSFTFDFNSVHDANLVAIIPDVDPNDPNSGLFKQYVTVPLSIVNPNEPNNPVPDGYAVIWSGTDDDEITGPNNTVTMDGDRTVTAEFTKLYKLTVVIEPNDRGVVSGLDPNTGPYYIPGTVVGITVDPCDGFRVKEWIGSDDDSSYDVNNTATVDIDNKIVTVLLEPNEVKEILIPHQYLTIEEGIDAARDGDIIVVSPKGDGSAYRPADSDGIDLQGKRITLIADPMYDEVVIDCNATKNSPRRAFYIHSGEDANTVISGFTIKGAFAVGNIGCSGCVLGMDPNAADNGDDANGAGYGGAIYIEGSSPTISNCIITGCTVAGGVGGDGANGLSEFGDDKEGQDAGDGGDAEGDGYGGAIYCDSDSSPVIRDCQISGNTALGGIGGKGGNGGNAEGDAKAGSGGNGGDGQGYGYGGGIYVADGGSAIVENCLIENNTALGGVAGKGGELGEGKTKDGETTIAWEGFDGQSTGIGRGGGMLAGQDCRITLSGSSFNVNHSKGHDEDRQYDPNTGGFIIVTEAFSAGGGLYCGDITEVNVTDCNFVGNFIGDTYEELESGKVAAWNASGPGNGGAVYCGKHVTINLIKSSFINNSNNSGTVYFEIASFYEYPNRVGDSEGGAIYLDVNSVADINDCVISGNNAYHDGGGIFSKASSMTIVDSAIGGNIAATGSGGGYYSYDANYVLDITVKRTSISQNTAYADGGGVSWRYFNGLVENCFFINNQAARAGGLYLVESTGATDINDCLINSNTASGASGGGMWTITLPAKIRNCVFMDNAAEGEGSYGGALSIYHQSPAITNCLFAGNSAAEFGGAVSCATYADTVISNCTFVNDFAALGGGIYCNENSSVDVNNSIFVNEPNYAVYNESGSGDVSYSCFWTGTDFGSEIIGEPNYLYNVVSDPNNLFDVNPKFADGLLGGYYLRHAYDSGMPGGYDPNSPDNSPCIDRGIGTAAALNLSGRTTDPNRNPIMDIGTVDIGYHYPATAVQYELDVGLIGGGGVVEIEPLAPDANGYYAGTVVKISVSVEGGYRVKKWTGSDDESSKEFVGYVVMTRNRVVTVELEPTQTWGVPSDFDTIQRAVDASGDGDEIVIAPGHYRHPGYEHGADPHLGGVVIWGKNITIASEFPDAPELTTLQGITFSIRNVGPQTVIKGFTIENMHWKTADGVTGPDPGDPGANGGCTRGGAMDIYNASPTIENIVINDISITAGHGSNGNDGDDSHPNGGNGGWGGSAYGGAIYIEDSSPTLKNVRFTGCAAIGGAGGNGGLGAEGGYGGRGGHWEWKTGEDGYHDDLYWEQMGLEWHFPRDRYGNLRFYGYYEAGMILISTGTFGGYDDHWLFAGMGGAVYIGSDSNPVFENCVFTDNRAESGYCGVGGTGANIFSWPDYHHRIESFGGAVFIEPGASPEFNDCRFIDNDANGEHGAANFSYYMGHGGGLCCGTLTPEDIDGEPKMTNCTFTGNTASGIGGGAWWNDTSPQIIDCNFSDNSAYLGGGMFFSYCHPRIIGTDFYRNQADYIQLEVNDVNLYHTIEVGITDDELEVGPARGDIIGIGGGLYVSSSPGLIGDSVFMGNTTRGSGGGACLWGELAEPDANELTVNNCLFVDNTAGIDGGAINIRYNCNAEIINCTLAENEATGLSRDITGTVDIDGYGGGLSCTYGGIGSVLNSIIWGNSSSYSLGAELSVGAYDPNELYVVKDNSVLTVSYSNVKGGQQFAFIRPANPSEGWLGGTLNWVEDPNDPDESTNLHGTSLDDPLFVNKHLDEYGQVEEQEYYLSQVAADDVNQPLDSLCVDRGFGTSGLLPLGSYRYTTRTDDFYDLDSIDIGYHYYKEGVFTAGDLNYDSIVDGRDAMLMLEYWLEGCQEPDWCYGADITRNGIVNFSDFAILSGYWGAGDIQTPIPNPMRWEILPAAASNTSITMTAVEAVDNSGLSVEYYFKCVYSGDPCNPGNDSGWIPERTYIDMGLTEGIEYGYKAKARDRSVNANETEWTFVGYALTGEDTMPPSPDPMEWFFRPASAGPDSIMMAAVEAVDDFGKAIEYYFERYSGVGDANSGWQSSPIWVDVNILNEEYGYRVKAREVRQDPNLMLETRWSKVAYATPGIDEAPPIPSPMVWEISPAGDGSDSITMVAKEAFDSSGGIVEYYFECMTDVNNSRDWSTERSYTNTGLNPGVQHCYRVRARDENDNRTDWSVPGCAMAGQDEAPPVPNPMTWLVAPAGYTDTSIIMTADDAVDNVSDYVEYYFENTYGNGHDRDWDPCSTYIDTGLIPEEQYGYKVRARDDVGNMTEWSVTGYAIAEDITAPSPDPMAWAAGGEPTVINNDTVVMTAATATDPDPNGVEYYFECSDPQFSRIWQDSTTYEVSGLDQTVVYSFRVKARDKSQNQNETEWSDLESTIIPELPNPNPSQWAVEPHQTVDGPGPFDYGFSMTAELPTDYPYGVEFYFECTSSGYGGFSSGWQGPKYERTSVSGINMSFKFRVRVRNQPYPYIITDWSPEVATK